MGIVTDWKMVVGITESDIKMLITEEGKSLYDFMEENLPAQFDLSVLNHGYDDPPKVFGVEVLGGNYHQYLNLEEIDVYTRDVIRTLNQHFRTNKFAIYLGNFSY